MAIGGTIDDGPFQDIVALDFPGGDDFLEVQSIKVSGSNAFRIVVLVPEDGRASEFTGTTAAGYNGETLVDSGIAYLNTIDITSSTVNICINSETIDIPDGASLVTWTPGITVADPPVLTKVVISASGVPKFTYTGFSQCGYDGTFRTYKPAS